jgi:hypothetical protein
MVETDHELAFLLSLDGFEFRLASGYVIKIEAQTVTATRHRPHGVKYSLTLHDLSGSRIYGMDMPMVFDDARNMTIGTCTAAPRWSATRIAVQRSC